MADCKWYLRLQDQVLGPLPEAELCDLAARGAVTAETLVSQDKATWTRAGGLPNLVFQPGPQVYVPPVAAAPPTAPGRNTTGWLIGGIALGGVAVLACGGLALVVIGALSTASGPATDGNWQATPVTQEQMVAQTTFAYWDAIRTSLAPIQLPANTAPQTAVAAWRNTSAQIRSLPTAGVDPEAVQCGVDVATVLTNLADFTERSNSPAIFVEAILRGAAGDLFGPTAEMLDMQSGMQQQLQYVQTELDNTRAMLSSRYGIEFPPL